MVHHSFTYFLPFTCFSYLTSNNTNNTNNLVEDRSTANQLCLFFVISSVPVPVRFKPQPPVQKQFKVETLN